MAYGFGRRQDDVCLEFPQLLAPFGLTKLYTDGWGAYERHRDAAQPQVGKENAQKIERKPIHLRTQSKRLVRRTLRFSKTEHMHNLVMDSSSIVTSLYGSSEMTSTPWRHLRPQ